MPHQDTRLGLWVETSVAGEKVRPFVPPPLPPIPPVDLGTFSELIERANLALGRLDGVTSILPAPPLFIFMYVRKEALLSSQIEGTQSSLSDLLLFEADELPMVPLDDVEEVSNYIAALEYGLDRMRKGFPLSLRLIREIHSILLKAGRGASSQAGEFRHSQNWIGGTRPGNAMFVPPPPDQLMQCLDSFEKFLHNDDRMPNVVKAALAHVQFETIHPFLDGNGRLGRLLITLFLCSNNVLREPRSISACISRPTAAPTTTCCSVCEWSATGKAGCRSSSKGLQRPPTRRPELPRICYACSRQTPVGFRTWAGLPRPPAWCTAFSNAAPS